MSRMGRLQARMIVLLIAGLVTTTAGAESARLREAREHFESGAKAYKLGDYERAIVEYKASYDLHPAPLLLYDLGQAYRKVGRFEQALHSYQQYMADAPPTSAHLADAQAQVDELKKLIDEQHARQSAPPDGVAEPERTATMAPPQVTEQRTGPTVGPSASSHRRTWYSSGIGWGLSVPGLLAAAAGAALLGHAEQLRSDAAIAGSLPMQNQLLADVPTYRISGAVVIAVGAAALVGGVLAFAMTARAHSRTGAVAVRAGVMPMINGGLTAVGGSW